MSKPNRTTKVLVFAVYVVDKNGAVKNFYMRNHISDDLRMLILNFLSQPKTPQVPSVKPAQRSRRHH